MTLGTFMKLLKGKKEKIVKKPIENVRELFNDFKFEDGMIVTPDGCSILLEVMPLNFNLKSEREKDYIIDQYEELFKVVKTPFSVFSISKPADTKAYSDFMRRHMATETNENVKSLIEQYIGFVEDVTYKNAVKRRFIIQIPYIPPPGIKYENVSMWDKKKWLFEKKVRFTSAIIKCGNEVASPEDDDQFHAQVMFELLNIKASETQRIRRL